MYLGSGAGIKYKMPGRILFIQLILLVCSVAAYGQLRIRLLASQLHGFAIFTVIEGQYELDG